MIVLDTNVISELMRKEPNPVVVDWVDAHVASELFITATTASELLFGVARLPTGRRKADLFDRLETMLAVDFAERVLSFDVVAASHYADIASVRERNGRPVGMADTQIAAVCRSYQSTLATRNVVDFADTGIDVENPWLAV